MNLGTHNHENLVESPRDSTSGWRQPMHSIIVIPLLGGQELVRIRTNCAISGNVSPPSDFGSESSVATHCTRIQRVWSHGLHSIFKQARQSSDAARF